MGRLEYTMNYYKYTMSALWVLESNTMSEVREWNILLGKMIYITLWSYGFTASPEKMQQ